MSLGLKLRNMEDVMDQHINRKQQFISLLQLDKGYNALPAVG